MADVNANIGVNIETSGALNQLKNLQRQISRFHSSVAKSSESAAIAQRDLQRNFLNSVNSIQGFSAELKNVKTTAESFTDSLEKNKLSVRQYFRYAAGASGKFSKSFKAEFSTIEKTAIERVKTLQTQYIKMGRDASGAMQAIAVRPTTLNMKDLGTQTAIAAQKQVLFNQLVKQGSTNLLNFGKNTQWAGRQLMVGFTLPLATLGMTAGRVFMDMEKAAIKFKKVYGDLFTAPEETEAAMESIIELGKEYTAYGVAVSDALDTAAEAAAAGFAGADLQNQTAAALKLSVLGQLDLNQALETTIALQNAFQISSKDLAGEIDFLNAVENQTVVALEDITTATPKVAPVIQQLGGDVRDLAFFLAAMKEGGVNATQGANALKSGLASLINPSSKAAEFLGDLGINIKGIVQANQGDISGTVVQFAKALDQLDPLNRAQAIEQLFGKFQFARISALFDNVTREGTQASRVLELAGSSLEDLANLSESELGVSAASSMNKFKKAIEEIKLALAPIGELFLNIATPIVEFGTQMLEAFNRLPDGFKKTIGTVITIIGGIGPVALMTFGLINNGIANMIKFFATVRMGYLKITGQAKGIGDETQYMTQEQLEAAAAAASLDQAHAGLTQRFTAEKAAVDQLTIAYQQAADAGGRFALLNPGMMTPGYKPGAKFAKGKMPGSYASGGVISGPGTGTSDSIPAMVSNGEAIIPADKAKQFSGLISAIINGDIPRFAKGTVSVNGDEYTVQSRQQSSRDAIQRLIDGSIGELDDVIRVALDALADDTKATVNTFKEEMRKAAEQAGKALGPEFNTSKSSTRVKTYNAKGAGITQSVAAQLTAERPESAALELEKANAEAEAIVRVLKEFGASAQQIEQALQIDRSHVVDVSNEQKRLAEAWSSDIWVAQSGAINNAIGNSLSKSERNRKVYVDALRRIGTSEEMIAVLADKATRNIALTGQEFEVQGAALREVAAAAQRGEIQADQVSKNFVMYATAVGEGQLAGAAVLSAAPVDIQAGVTRTTGELRRGIERLASELPEAAAQALQNNSPSKRMQQVGRDGAEGLVQGAKSQIDDAQVAGQQIGQALVSGATSQSQGISGPRRASSGGVITKDPQSGNLVNPSKASKLLEGRQKGLARATQMSMTKIEGFSKKLSGATFGISAVAGAASMFGGKIGEAAGAVMQVTSLMFVLSTATAALAKSQNAAAAMSMVKGLASGRVAGGFRGGATGVKGLKNIVGNIGGVFKKLFPILTKIPVGFTALLGPLAAVAAVIGVGAIAYKKANESINRLGETANLSADKLGKLGDIFGVEVKSSGFSSAFTGAAGTSIEERSAAQKVIDSEEFDKDFGTQIDAIKNAGKADAERTLNALAIQLSSSGFDTDAVQAIIDGIVTETERTDLDLSFSSIKFSSKEGLSSIDKIANDTSALLNEKFAAMGTDAGQRFLNFFGGGDFQTQIETSAGEFASLISALKIGFESGEVSAADFNQKLALIDNSINSLDPSAAKELVEALADNLEMKDEIDGIKSYKDQLMLIKAAAAGIKIPDETVKLLEDANKAGADEDTLNAAIALRKELNQAIRDTATATEDANEAQAEQQIIDAKIQEAIDSISETTTQLQEQAAAHQTLIDLGYDEETAYRIASNAMYAAAIAAAVAADGISGTTDRVVELMGYLDEMAAAERAAPVQRSSGGGGGTKEKSPFEEAMEQLGKQRTEISNTITAYGGLRKAGFSAAEAMRIAGDATMAAALASTKVGTKQWKELVNQLRLVREEALKTEEGLRNAFDELKGQAFEYFDILTRQVDRKYEDSIRDQESAIDDLGDAIRDVNDEIEDYQDRLEDIQRTMLIDFDRPIEVLNEESSDLANDLTLMDKAADEITKRYEEQASALAEVAKANQEIINQQKSQISLADALSSGDISAAAGIMQDMRAAGAAAAATTQQSMLDAAQQTELDGLRSGSGMSRIQIEERQFQIGQKIYRLEEQREKLALRARDIEDDIYDIQKDKLEPLQDQLTQAERALEVTNDQKKAELEHIESIKRRWTDAELALDLAAIAAGDFNDVIQMSKDLTGDVLANWEALKSKTITLTVNTVTNSSGGSGTPAAITSGGTTGGSGGGGGGNKDTGTPPKPTADAGYAKKWVYDSSSKKWVATFVPKPSGTPFAGAVWTWSSGDSWVPEPKPSKPSSSGIPAGMEWVYNVQTNKWDLKPKPTSGINQDNFSPGRTNYYATGGVARGTDTIPAMLTPGEFVVNRRASAKFKPVLEAINSGTFGGGLMGNRYSKPRVFGAQDFNTPVYNMPERSYPGGGSSPIYSTNNEGSQTQVDNSVYNYSLNVSVEGSNSSADQIASVVMNRIRNMQSQQVKRQVVR